MVLPSCYLAPVAYYQQLLHAGKAEIEVCDHYVKQTLRNRCWIDSPSGPLALTIPVEKAEGKQAMRDVRISDHGNWRHQHWQALVSSYRQSPFFEFLADDHHAHHCLYPFTGMATRQPAAAALLSGLCLTSWLSAWPEHHRPAFQYGERSHSLFE